MTVLDPDVNAGQQTTGSKKLPRQRDRVLRVEPTLALEWSNAIEPAGVPGIVESPATGRRAWIHRADESQVLAMFRAIGAHAPAPWWLRALDRGRIASRSAAFAVEDEVTTLLAERPGWVFVPWADDGEVGYWEFVPSESGVYGPAEPTTVQFTDRHTGWVDLLPTHRGSGTRQPIEFTPDLLRERIEDVENIA
ncbi:hypothetical protein GCM10022243_27090 [Saccharothrix violaceirubra]|uniref:Uncharacterized protein n=1 Tax=Saccharothrix violaceirubra TaxID=413306 RepID=A0A7W7TA55_9PSEU|nr:hypothetical protein [Saccharothrix violaceirubra]MBB4969368.1 hypothetical protein [Saccharothrix violaceirubra]